MKKLILIFGFLSVSFSNAQTTTTENYISTTNCLNEDCTKKTETVQYFDLLGRAKQVVNVKATPLGKDIVTPIVFDDQGRQTRSYLPVPQNSTSNGAIYSQTPGMVPYPVADVTNIYSGEKTYTEAVLENSPLQRVLQQKQIGNDWNTKPVVFEYDTNNSNEVYKYVVTTTWENGVAKNTLSLPSAQAYPPNQLFKSAVTDEDGIRTVEFKNGKGQVVLIRKMLSASEQVDTYYVYNDYGQLAFVLPPNTLHKTITDDLLNDLCYQYRYDARGRQVEKKLPGKGWEYFVYDKQDRIVAVQDANLREKGQWGYTKYDQFGRVVITGISTGGERSQEQDIANSYGSNNVNRLSTVLFERQGMEVYYGNPDATYPNSTKWVSLLSLNYYDTYPAYSFNPSFPTAIQGESILKDGTSESKSTRGLPVMSLVKNIEDDNWTKNYIYYDLKGRAIGSHTINHLGGYTKTESALDFAGLAKQTKAFHKRLATDAEKVITQTYTYDGQNRLLVHKHQIDNNPEEILVQNQYNELSQLKNKKLGGTNIAQPLQSIDYNYNIRGWLTKINDPSSLNGKLFGYEMKYNNPANPNVTPGRFTGIITEIDWNNASENVMKRYNYTYDGLNRLKDAVYSEPNATTPFNNNYNEYLTYDLNGNIKTLKRNAFPVTGTTATQVDDLVYDYTGNRLTKVTENALNDTGYEGGNNAISYDLNGNMKDMLDKGIQSIAYNYLNLSDKLTIQQPNPFGAMTEGYISYLYRADGTKLRKNYFIPGGRGYVAISRVTEYLDGFQYSYREGASSCLTCRTETSFEAQAYKNSLIDFPVQEPQWNLDFVATAEGYYSFMENRYIYQYKDHLGNARVNFAKDSAGALQIIDTNNYYPFGLSHTGGNGLNISNSGSFNSYKYNGKELQETGMFDYGWRQYMPDLGRWNGMDQLSEAYTSTSPFAYVANNPVSMRDPDGRWMDANGHIDTSGNANPFRDMAQSRLLMNEFLGRNPGEGGGGGYLAFGQTQAYADLMTAFFNGGTGGLTNKNGTLMWWTNYDDPDPNVKGIGMLSMLKLSSYSDIPEIRQSYYNFNPYKPDNTPEWYGFGGRANWGIATAAASLEKFSGQTRITTTGSTIKLYRPNANGNVFIKNAYTKTTGLNRIGNIAGKASFGIGVTMDIIGVYNYYKNPESLNKVHPAKAGLNTVMGAYGLTGAGTIPALLYFGVDAFYPGGWEGYGNDYQSIQSDNSAIMPGFITAPYGSQKF